jgi:hypothetical protein
MFRTFDMVNISTTIRRSWVKAGFEDCEADDASDLLIVMGRSEVPLGFPKFNAISEDDT